MATLVRAASIRTGRLSGGARSRALNHRARMERVTAGIVILLALWIGTVRMQALIARAEETSVSTTVSHLNSGLMLEAAVLLVRGERSGLAALERANPMQAVARLPPNYIGEIDPAQAHTVEGGVWYYQRAGGFLAYRYANEPQVVRYRTKLRFNDRNRNGRFDPSSDEFTGIALVRVDA